jgi:hypothetical protein
MASAYATKLAEGFSQKLIQHIYETAPIDEIVNRDYEGEINAVGSYGDSVCSPDRGASV